MSPPWFSTWGSIPPFALFNLGATTSCSCILSIVFRRSTFILETSISTNVPPPLTLVYTCSSIFSFGANAYTSSTLAYVCYLITPTFTFPFITPPTPFVDSTKTCWSVIAFFVFFQVWIQQKKPKKPKENEDQH
jgi:hypothetical protein